jgi:hypothetical protein
LSEPARAADQTKRSRKWRAGVATRLDAIQQAQQEQGQRLDQLIAILAEPPPPPPELPR